MERQSGCGGRHSLRNTSNSDSNADTAIACRGGRRIGIDVPILRINNRRYKGFGWPRPSATGRTIYNLVMVVDQRRSNGIVKGDEINRPLEIRIIQWIKSNRNADYPTPRSRPGRVNRLCVGPSALTERGLIEVISYTRSKRLLVDQRPFNQRRARKIIDVARNIAKRFDASRPGRLYCDSSCPRS